MSTTGTYVLPQEIFDWVGAAAKFLAGVKHDGYADKETADKLLEWLVDMGYATMRPPLPGEDTAA